MKSSDEIKKGLEEEIPVHYHIDGEPRLTPRLFMDMQWLHKDALALVQQLQAENADLLADNGQLTIEVTLLQAKVQQLEAELKDTKANHQHTIDIAERQKSQIDKLKKVIVRLNAERDAAVDGLKSNCTCPECKYFSDDIQEPCRDCKPTDSKFEWRGGQKEG